MKRMKLTDRRKPTRVGRAEGGGEGINNQVKAEGDLTTTSTFKGDPGSG